MKVYQEAVVTLPQATPEGVYQPVVHTGFRQLLLANFIGFTVSEAQQFRYDEDELINDPVFVYTVLLESAEDESLLREISTEYAEMLEQGDFVFKTIYGEVLILEVPDAIDNQDA